MHHAVQYCRQRRPIDHQQHGMISRPQEHCLPLLHPQPPDGILRFDAVATAGQAHYRHDRRKARRAYHRRAAAADYALQLGIGRNQLRRLSRFRADVVFIQHHRSYRIAVH